MAFSLSSCKFAVGLSLGCRKLEHTVSDSGGCIALTQGYSLARVQSLVRDHRPKNACRQDRPAIKSAPVRLRRLRPKGSTSHFTFGPSQSKYCPTHRTRTNATNPVALPCTSFSTHRNNSLPFTTSPSSISKLYQTYYDLRFHQRQVTSKVSHCWTVDYISGFGVAVIQLVTQLLDTTFWARLNRRIA